MRRRHLYAGIAQRRSRPGSIDLFTLRKFTLPYSHTPYFGWRRSKGQRSCCPTRIATLMGSHASSSLIGKQEDFRHQSDSCRQECAAAADCASAAAANTAAKKEGEERQRATGKHGSESLPDRWRRAAVRRAVDRPSPCQCTAASRGSSGTGTSGNESYHISKRVPQQMACCNTGNSLRERAALPA